MIKKAIRTVRVMLGNPPSVSKKQIEESVDEVIKIPSYAQIDRDKLIREIESIYNVRAEDYRIIERDERKRKWLNDKQASISWDFWLRYSEYLQDEKNFPPDTIEKLNGLTNRILDNLFDPTQNVQIDKRGMVVGQVQSGKTSNYTGLICKAVDLGFKLVIVLAGIHNNLRSQTQLRLDEGFLGFDTQHTRAFNQNKYKIGVGNINQDIVAHSLTSSLDSGDFTQGAANSSGFNFDTNEPIIAVVKKNPSVLRRLHQWLSSRAPQSSNGERIISTKAVLLIDDEADHASINTNKEEWEPTRINGQIRDILRLFRKSAYVGYTATPFANIFINIDDDNLFPRDFIVNIPPPSNYIGPEKVFGYELENNNYNNTLPIVNPIDDYGNFVPDRHKHYDQLPSFVPDSLKKAIRCFIITCAIRRYRGQDKVHNSMLVHVSRFKRWQDQVTELIQNQFNYYRMGINQNDPEILESFRNTFENDSTEYLSYITVSNQILNSELKDIDSQIQVHTWSQILPHLNEAASRIEVKAIHGSSGEVLDYYDHKDGLSVIAVGGNKLSRGLTLEGLSVSYYLRSSRMYDTLMQMGRWFGYRPGYVDLCRLFTSNELNEWFSHIAHASEELREEFDYMSDRAGSTPEQYALRVRSHPGVLQISASNKMRNVSKVIVSHAGRLVESYELKKDISAIRNNINELKNFISNLSGGYVPKDNALLWYNVSPDNIIDFLNNYKSIENLKAYEPEKLINFINKQILNNELTSWRVALMNKPNAANSTDIKIANENKKIGQWKRTHNKTKGNDIYFIKKSHIISPKDEFIDLTKEEYENAIELTKRQKKSLGINKETKFPNGQIVRNEIRGPENPLLLIYLLDPIESKTGMDDGTPPFVGYAISFPRSNNNAPVEYAVHEQLLPQFNEDFNNDEEIEDDEE